MRMSERNKEWSNCNVSSKTYRFDWNLYWLRGCKTTMIFVFQSCPNTNRWKTRGLRKASGIRRLLHLCRPKEVRCVPQPWCNAYPTDWHSPRGYQATTQKWKTMGHFGQQWNTAKETKKQSTPWGLVGNFFLDHLDQPPLRVFEYLFWAVSSWFCLINIIWGIPNHPF